MRMAELVKKNPSAVVGALVWLWSRAMTQSHSGTLSLMTASMIDRAVGIRGFAAAAESVGWLELSESGAQIPEFDKYFGQSAKTRSQTRLRVSRHRDKDAKSVTPVTLERYRSVTGADTVVTGSVTTARSRPDQTRPDQTGSDLTRPQPEQSGAEQIKPDQTRSEPAASAGLAGPESSAFGSLDGGWSKIVRRRLLLMGVHEPTLSELAADVRLTPALLARVEAQAGRRNGSLRKPGAWSVGAIRNEMDRSNAPTGRSGDAA
jgi:hypothetical protein